MFPVITTGLPEQWPGRTGAGRQSGPGGAVHSGQVAVRDRERISSGQAVTRDTGTRDPIVQ